MKKGSIGSPRDGTSSPSSSFDRILASLRFEHERVLQELFDARLSASIASNTSPNTSVSLEIAKERLEVCAAFGETSTGADSNTVKRSKQLSHSYSGPRGVLKVAKTAELFPALHVQAERNLIQADSKRKLASGKSAFQNFVQGEFFETCVLVMIVLSVVVMCFERQYSGHSIAYSLRVPGYHETGEQRWPGAVDAFIIIERIFLIAFFLELVLRLLATGLEMFCQVLNWVDLLVVILGILNWIGSDVFNPKMLRLLRLFKLARLMRGFTKRQFFDAIRFLLISIHASLSTLFWSLCVLVCLQLIAALCVNQLVDTWLVDAPANDGSREVFLYYGTFTRSVVSMFEVLIGNWAVPVRVLTLHVAEWWGAVLLVYRCICGFSILNVISAVFIQQTMKTMSQDTDVMLLERVRMETAFKNNLKSLFRTIDVNDDGVITKQELNEEMTDPTVRLKCFNLGVDVHDLEDIFNVFCDKNDGMKVSDFIHAAHSVRKQSNTLDIARLLMHSRELQRQVRTMRDNLRTISEVISRQLHHSVSPRAGPPSPPDKVPLWL